MLEQRYIEPRNWFWTVDDEVIFDVEANMGYILKRTGQYTSFKIASGQKRVVRYIGRTYAANTPLREWTVLSKDIKGDTVTFGKRGIFLRLYVAKREGFTEDSYRKTIADKEYFGTPYGIHSHRSYAEMLARESDERYASMGCVIVDEETLDLLTGLYERNGELLKVRTMKGSESLFTPDLALIEDADA